MCLPQLVHFGVLFIQPHIGAYFRLRRVDLCVSLPTSVQFSLTVRRTQGDVLRWGFLCCKNSHRVSWIPPRVFISALFLLNQVQALLEVSTSTQRMPGTIHFLFLCSVNFSLQLWSRAGRMRMQIRYLPIFESDAFQMAKTAVLKHSS